MKRLVCIIAVIAVALSFSACGGVAQEAQTEFENMMDAFKTCDKAQIDEYYSFENLVSYIEAEEGELLSNAILSTLSKMDYKVNSAEKINSNAVKLNVEITTVDFSVIMRNYIDKVMALVASSEYQSKIGQMDEKEYQSLMVAQMIASIEGCGDERTSKMIDVTMTKGTSGWTVGGNSDEFLGALFENMSNALESLM